MLEVCNKSDIRRFGNVIQFISRLWINKRNMGVNVSLV